MLDLRHATCVLRQQQREEGVEGELIIRMQAARTKVWSFVVEI